MESAVALHLGLSSQALPKAGVAVCCIVILSYMVFIIKKFPFRCRTTSVERSSIIKKTVCERCMNAKQAFALNGPIKRT